MTENLPSHIQRLIANNETEHALLNLEVSLRNKDQDLHEQVIMLAHKYKSVQKHQRLGTMETDEISVELAQINQGLLDIAKEVPEDISLRHSNVLHPSYILKKPWYKRYSFSLLMVMYALLAAVCFILLSIPNKRLLIEIDMEANRIDFKFESGELKRGGNFTLNESIEEIQIQQFEKIIIPTRKASLDLDLDGITERNIAISNGLEISQTIGGSLMSFNNVSLQELYFSAGAQFIFTLAPEEEGSLILDVIDPDTNYGALAFRDSTAFFVLNEVAATGWDYREDIQYMEGKLYDYGRPIRFIGKEGKIRLEIFNGKALNFEKEEGIINNLYFLNIREGVPISSILSAKIRMLTNENYAFDSLNVDKGEFFVLESSEAIRLESLTISPDRIRLKAQGYVRQMKWGNNLEQLKLQNPSLLQMWWHNHRYKFIFLFLVLGAATFLLSRRWLKGW